MQSYSCLIIDDEPPARAVLKRYVESLPMLQLVGECGNAFEVIAFLHDQNVDILFLDIQMPQLSGLELMNTLEKPPKVIFTTAFSDYALQSYELDAVDYLLKPFKFERFVKAVNKAIRQVEPMRSDPTLTLVKPLAEADNFLYFRADRKMVKVTLANILYIESLKDYVRIVTSQEQVITKCSMTAMEAMLPRASFLRIHRSFMVSLSKICSFSQSHIQLPGVEVPIGKLYLREVMTAIRPLG
jgi:DNA-binding LytR/AlgR family response regulator